MRTQCLPDGLVLTQICKLKELDPEELAKKLEPPVTRSRISQMQNDIRITPDAKRRINKATGLSFDEVKAQLTPRPWALYLVAILIFCVFGGIGFYFWMPPLIAPVSISQPGDVEEFHKLYDPIPESMKKEEITAMALYQGFTDEDKRRFPGALKNYISYEKCQAISAGQSQLTPTFMCKDKNFFDDRACGFRNYIKPRACPSPISIVRGRE